MHLITSASILVTLSSSVTAATLPLSPKPITPLSKLATPVSEAVSPLQSLSSPIHSELKGTPLAASTPPKISIGAGGNAAASAKLKAAELILSAQLSAIAQLSLAPLNPRPPPLPTSSSRAICPCFTATVVSSDPGCPMYTPPGSQHCVHPLCFELLTTTVPASNSFCPFTPTYTSYLPCETNCVRGCGTGTTTVTAKETCLAQSRPSGPPKSQSFDDPLTRSFSSEKIPTPTPPKSSAAPTPIPPKTPSTPVKSSTPTPPPTPTPRPRPCYTSTFLLPPRCPAEATCPSPDCIFLSTISVPAGPVKGCTVTPTQTVTRSCRGCGGCNTSYTTVTVSEWVEVRESASAGVRAEGVRGGSGSGKAGDKKSDDKAVTKGPGWW